MRDFSASANYYRKSALIIKIVKYLVILVFILSIIFGIVVFRKDITVENIQLLAKFISLNGSSSHYSDEFSIASNDDCRAIMLRDNLGIISNNNISLYDLSGQKLFSYNYSYSVPSVVNDSHNILVHDISGNELTIFNSFSKIKSMRFDRGIYAADIYGNHVAVVTGEDTYKSVLKVYEFDYRSNDYIEVFKLRSSSFYLTSVALSPGGRYVLVTGAEANEGSYDCAAYIYDITSASTEPVYSSQIIDELPIFSDFADDGNSVYIVTDSNIIFYSPGLSDSEVYKFNQSKIENFYTSDKMIVLTEKNNLAGNSIIITGISPYGDVIFRENLPDEVFDIAIGKAYLFALGKRGVYKFGTDSDGSFKILEKTDISEKYHFIVCDTDDNCYVLNDTQTKKISFTDRVN